MRARPSSEEWASGHGEDSRAHVNTMGGKATFVFFLETLQTGLDPFTHPPQKKRSGGEVGEGRQL